jgi:hypothetical protein
MGTLSQRTLFILQWYCHAMITPTHSVCSYKPFSFIARKRLQNAGFKLEITVIVTNNQTWQWNFTLKEKFFLRHQLLPTAEFDKHQNQNSWQKKRSLTFHLTDTMVCYYFIITQRVPRMDAWMDGWMHRWMHRWLINILSNIQARGPKKHMKRLNAPKHWMLDKLLGEYSIFSPFYE